MSNFSAAQVISPAIERTKLFLLKPFRLGRFLKLTLVAVLTEGGVSSCNFNSHFPSGKTGGSETPFHFPVVHWPPMQLIVAIAIGIILIVVPISILISYLLIRLRFSYFDCVLHGQDRIGPAWSRYHRAALRYLGLGLCVGLGFWVVLIPIGYAIYQHFRSLFQSIGSSTPPNFADFLPVIGIVIPVVLLLALVGYLVHTFLTCFVLPRMALEDASILESLDDVWNDLRVEPGQFALFILLRIVLSIAASILAFLVLLIPAIILVVIGVIVALILKAVSTTMMMLLGIPAAILAFALILVAGIAIGGTIGTFRRNYAILFYAGRYPPLAMVLWPPPPPAPPSPQPPQWTSGLPPTSVEGV
jgi:hypothetical protein